ncbi:MAG: hypothetical protein OEL89_00625 [Candidatus Peregrinibacteria bacterium]|nr:hypothetical protein [Candidatus Peregrinibacteria bacterium]
MKSKIGGAYYPRSMMQDMSYPYSGGAFFPSGRRSGGKKRGRPRKHKKKVGRPRKVGRPKHKRK